ncbi:MAG: enoyl-CoA hydratase/isomerase family protein, partial [Phyllobacterium sp.]
MSDRRPSTPAATDADILVDTIANGGVQIWLNRPDRLNALGVGMIKSLTQAVEDAVASQACMIVIRARGRAFCAGADLKERQEMDEAARYGHNRLINDAINAVAAAPVPTIAVLNGLALGGGCELALGCDIRIAAESAQIGLTESRIGAIPGAGGTQRLPRRIGISRALDLMYTGEPVSARKALELGLVNACV